MNDKTEDRPKRARRWLWWAGGGILALVAVGAIVLYVLAARFVNANYIAAAVEEENNCRVEIGGISWRFPATIVLKGLQIAPRDSVVENGVPHDERAPIASEGVIRIGSGTIKADASGLLGGGLRLREILLDDVLVTSVIDEEGNFSLEELFEEPASTKSPGDSKSGGKGNGQEKPKGEAGSPGEEEAKGEDEDDDSLAVPPTLDLFRIQNGRFVAHTEETNSIIELEDLDIEIRDFDIDPSSLGEHRSAHVHIDTVMNVFNEDRTFQWAEFDLVTDGEVVLLDETGEFNPDLDYTFVVKKGSRIADLPTLGKLGERIESLRKIGIRLRSLGRKLEFDEDANLVMRLRQGDLSLLEPGEILFSGHRLFLDKGSHLQTGNNDHRFDGELHLSPNLSKEALDESVRFLSDQLGLDSGAVRPLLEMSMEPAMKNGRIWLPFVSKGNLGRPEVDLRVKLKNPLESFEEDAGKAALKLLEGLFNK